MSRREHGPERDPAGRQRLVLPSSLPSSLKVSQHKHHAGGTSCTCFAPATSPSTSTVFIAYSCCVFLILPIPCWVFFFTLLCHFMSPTPCWFGVFWRRSRNVNFTRLGPTQSSVCRQNGWPWMYRPFYAIEMEALTHEGTNPRRRQHKRN